MKIISKTSFLCMAVAILSLQFVSAATTKIPTVGQYRLFEASVVNDNAYENKFTNVELEVQYQAPSGRIVNFYGFFDGDGQGSGDATTGNVWKMRFMPDEVGTWKYVYRWSDGTKGGSGAFTCTKKNAGKGILKAYYKNPRWLAYNGRDPVWLKSYYETGHGSIGQDFDWITKNVYQRFVDSGYNHLQVNWLMSLCCFGQYYKDGPEPETMDLSLYEEGEVMSTMNLDVWQRMERHLGWLNDRDIGVHMFLGVDGSQNDGPAWTALTAEEQDFYVRYMVARIAPFANLAGWNFVWEVDGDNVDRELGFARLVKKYDIFEHLLAYEDEMPRENFFHLPEYTFAAVENHRIAAPTKAQEKHLWRSAWTHHMACLLGYKGKPVYMSEGNSLWRRYWHERVGATQLDLLRSAWACVTAGASFNWNGHAREYELYVGGSEGLPFNEDNPYTLSKQYIDIIADVMNHSVQFYSMEPHDELLSAHQVLEVYALAEPGEQYLVFTPDGQPFALSLETGSYQSVIWIDAKTGSKTTETSISSNDHESPVPFTAPNTESDWILVVRRK